MILRVGIEMIEERKADGSLILLFSFQYDQVGRITEEFAGPLPKEYTPETYTATYDADNRLATFNGDPAFHDSDGNMTVGPLLDDTLKTYSYDARNRLKSVGGVTYAYDAEGNRISSTKAGGTTSYAIDPNTGLSKLLVRTKPDGSKTYYVYGMGLVYEVDESENTLSYHYDYRGSTRFLTDDSESVTDSVEYSPYGLVTHRTGSTDTPFLYNGAFGVMAEANGLYHMRARFYNPYTRRFVNPDPIGFSGGMNWYAYAAGNPILYADDTGEAVETVWDLANVGIGAASLGYNISEGNWGAATVDTVGLIYDGFATSIPFLPAGASAGLKAYRAGNTVVDAVNIGTDVARIAESTHSAARTFDPLTDVVPWQAALDGSALHKAVDANIGGSLSRLSDDFLSGSSGKFGRQPDFLGNGVWADITTANQWSSHVNRYSGAFGQGIPIIYQRGVGITNSTRLMTGAGIGLNAIEYGGGTILDTGSSIFGYDK